MNLNLKGQNSGLEILELYRKQKEDQWYSHGIKLEIEKTVEVYLSTIVNSHTLRAKRSDLNQFVDFLKVNMINTIGDLGELISPELTSTCEGYLDCCSNKTATIQRKKATIKTFFSFLQFNFPKIITHLPKLDSSRYKLRRTKGVTEALTLEQWFRLKNEIEKAGSNLRLLILCQTSLLLGGRRISELLRLKWEDINFECGIVALKPSKKGVDVTLHHLPLTDQLSSILLGYRSTVYKDNVGDLLFPVTQQSIDESLKRYGTRVGLSNICFHSLRATFITWASERGDSQSEILNATLHSSSQMIRYYDKTSSLKTNSIRKMGSV